jgi:hypothetical protein
MKRPDFGDILKVGKLTFFQVLRVSCALKEFKFPPKISGYLKGHKCIDSLKQTWCVV